MNQAATFESFDELAGAIERGDASEIAWRLQLDLVLLYEGSSELVPHALEKVPETLDLTYPVLLLYSPEKTLSQPGDTIGASVRAALAEAAQRDSTSASDMIKLKLGCMILARYAKQVDLCMELARKLESLVGGEGMPRGLATELGRVVPHIYLQLALTRALQNEISHARGLLYRSAQAARRHGSTYVLADSYAKLAVLDAFCGDRKGAETALELLDQVEDIPEFFQEFIELSKVQARAQLSVDCGGGDSSVLFTRLDTAASPNELWSFDYYARCIEALAGGNTRRVTELHEQARATHGSEHQRFPLATDIDCYLYIEAQIQDDEVEAPLSQVSDIQSVGNLSVLASMKLSLYIGSEWNEEQARNLISSTHVPESTRLQASLLRAWHTQISDGTIADSDVRESASILLSGVPRYWLMVSRAFVQELTTRVSADEARELTRLLAITRVAALPKRLQITLNDREETLLLLLSQSLTNRQIGEQLFLSENTVKGHLANLFRKLGVKSRREAVRVKQMRIDSL